MLIIQIIHPKIVVFKKDIVGKNMHLILNVWPLRIGGIFLGLEITYDVNWDMQINQTELKLLVLLLLIEYNGFSLGMSE